MTRANPEYPYFRVPAAADEANMASQDGCEKFLECQVREYLLLVPV